MLPKKIFVLLGLLCVAVGLKLWWSFGPPLSAETSYHLAVEHAQIYAGRNHIDLSKYNDPVLSSPEKGSVYVFKWTPKDHTETPLTIVVDPKSVEVSVIESPGWGK